ncbi:hypothetical protein BD408DRAFT_479515 [Parasitella parasitica]|nr:hypothetical protein BD408DRAFT_479515 [Parasitella parasitica]
MAGRLVASLILPEQTAVRITLVCEQGIESWTVDRITQVSRNVLGDDNTFYAHVTTLLPGVVVSGMEKGYLCYGDRPPEVGPSATGLSNREVFATSVVPVPKAQAPTKDLVEIHAEGEDFLMGELNFDYKLQSVVEKMVLRLISLRC